MIACRVRSSFPVEHDCCVQANISFLTGVRLAADSVYSLLPPLQVSKSATRWEEVPVQVWEPC